MNEQSTSVSMTEPNIVAYGFSIAGSEDETGDTNIINLEENTEVKEEVIEETMDIDDDIEEMVEEESKPVTYRKVGEVKLMFLKLM